MKIVIFGLSISSSWGNGHATLWRALCRALHRLGHEIVFFERDAPFYAATRDADWFPYCQLIVYPDWARVLSLAVEHVRESDVAMVTSYCADGIAATRLVAGQQRSKRLFYDLDTPITLGRLARGEAVEYIDPELRLSCFDMVLSYTGGDSLLGLQKRLDAPRVEPLYGSVDPDYHRPAPPEESYRSDCSYLGTYAADRQARLDELFLEPARQLPQCRFMMGGAQYPADFPWGKNIFFARHVPPEKHPAFYCSSPLTINVTRRAMAETGYCPSGRLFEAAACGVPIASDCWPGLDTFYEPGREMLFCNSASDVVEAIKSGPDHLRAIGLAARERTLSSYTAMHRAREFEAIINRTLSGSGGKLKQSGGIPLCGESFPPLVPAAESSR